MEGWRERKNGKVAQSRTAFYEAEEMRDATSRHKYATSKIPHRFFPAGLLVSAVICDSGFGKSANYRLPVLIPVVIRGTPLFLVG